LATSCCQIWKDWLVELHGVLDVAGVERAAVGHRRGVRGARRDVDVGLAEDRLLAQDRGRALAQRHVLALQLERRERPVAVRVELLAHDLADRHAGDPHVGLAGELRGVRERDLDLVALGAERDGTAEREPQEQQQPDAREREQHHRHDPGD
jgi:hypothetical protein